MRKVLFLCLGVLALALVTSCAAWADDIVDPADLHIGTGAGTPCAQGCGADPNVISATGFDIFYNPNQNSSQSPIGDPFYLIVASAVYTGSNNSPTVNSTATMYAPYPNGATTTVSVGPAVNNGTMTSGDIYSFLGLGSQITNSFNFGNMVACDTGVGCTNGSLNGSNAPLFGQTITGYVITTFSIGTTNFGPQDLLDFTGTLPIGSYVAAIGINGIDPKTGKPEGWAVPFTESGIVATTPEPGSLLLLGAGLVGLAVFASRRLSA